MKHIFIINPKAGKGQAKKLLPIIVNLAKSQNLDYEIHRTMRQRDAEFFVKRKCASRIGEQESLRFYSCGGDGTFHEVINGALGKEGVEVALIPLGTGNDFVRSFPDWKSFLDVEKQIEGQALLIDIIRYEGIRIDDKEISGYCVNMMNLGFECDVVIKARQVKSWLPLTGPLVYGSAATSVIAKNRCFHAKVQLDEDFTYEGKVFMLTIANGRFCGGGFQSVPTAQFDDGLLDVNLVQKIDRSHLIRLIGHYKKGTHTQTAIAQKVLWNKRCKKINIFPQKVLPVSVDGEIIYVKSLSASVWPGALQFSCP